MSKYVWYKDGKVFKETSDVEGEKILKQYYSDGGYYDASYSLFYDSGGKVISSDIFKIYRSEIGEHFSGNLYLRNTPDLTSLGNLKSVDGWLDISRATNLKSLGDLEGVSGWLELFNTPKLTSLGNLKSVGGEIFYDIGSNTEKLLKERGLI